MKTKTMLKLTIGAFVLCAALQAHASIVADYQFDNNLHDSSGNGLNATGGNGSYSLKIPSAIINPGSLTDTASYAPGSTAATVAANSLLSNTFDTGSFTVQAFIYLNAGAGNFQEVFSDEVGKTGIYFGVGTGNGFGSNLDGYNGNGAEVVGTTGTGLATGTWEEVAWVGTLSLANGGTTVQFYVNGVADGSAKFFAINHSNNNTISLSSANWNMGCNRSVHFRGA